MGAQNSTKYIIGVDEVGRGPLAGPITVCAVLIQKNKSANLLKQFKKYGIKDSKKVSAKKREELYKKIKNEKGLIFTTCSVSASEIDKIGIARATKTAIRRSMRRLKVDPKKSEVKLDGLLYASRNYLNQKTIIKGDEKEIIIATASILAKVTRDRKMKRLHYKFPEYGFSDHMGYGTKFHIESIKKNGLSSVHRVSFCRNI